MELLSNAGTPTASIPPAFQSLIPAFGPQPPCCGLPRNVWIHLNRLRTRVSRFVVNMKTMGLCRSEF